jgi:hypothetical protein
VAALYEGWNPVTRRYTEVTLDDETGLPLILHTQDVRPIVEDCKRRASAFDKHAPNPHGMTLVARIPTVVWLRWERLGITRDQKALNAVLDSREARAFRTDDSRRL